MAITGFPLTEEALRTPTSGGLQPLSGRIPIVDADPGWQMLFEPEAELVRNALGARALGIEHAGSTSVPGLPAKPTIDIVLVVENSADETAYLPQLEPDWHEHRLFQGPDSAVNLHVF